MKKSISANLVFALSMLTVSAAVVTVSNRGQPADQTTRAGVSAEYNRVRLTARDVESNQLVFLMLAIRGTTSVQSVEGEVYLRYGSDTSNSITLAIDEQMIFGPIDLGTNSIDVSVWASVTNIVTSNPDDQPIFSLNVTGGHTNSSANVTFEGAFPLVGSSHWIWMEEAPPEARISKFRLLNFGDGPRELFLTGTIKPDTSYDAEGSTDLTDWERIGGVDSIPFPTLDDYIGTLDPKYANRAFFRLKESP